ncbi:MAG: SIMPL domain-containing protein [Thermoleophilia bacterium]
MKRLALAAVLLVVLIAAVGGVARPEGARAVDGVPQTGDSITVSGSGSVSVVPTTAVFSFGVDSRAATARTALAANAREMRLVIVAAKAAGGRRVATQSVSLSQVFGPNNEPAGFAASNTVSATIDLDRVGAVIDAAVEAGANQVNGPMLGVTDQGKLYREALTKAVTDARASAEVLATASGRSLGRVMSVVEGGGSAPVPIYGKSAVSDIGTPIEPGTQETRATITVTFALV